MDYFYRIEVYCICMDGIAKECIGSIALDKIVSHRIDPYHIVLHCTFVHCSVLQCQHLICTKYAGRSLTSQLNMLSVGIVQPGTGGRPVDWYGN